MRKKLKIQELQQIQQDEQQYLGGLPPHLVDEEVEDYDVDINNMDIPVLTPTTPKLQTPSQVVKQIISTDEVKIPQFINELQQQKLVEQLQQQTNDVVLQLHDESGNIQQEIVVPKRLSKFRTTLRNVIKPLSDDKIQQTPKQQKLVEDLQQKLVEEVIQPAIEDVEITNTEDVKEIIETVESVSEVLDDIPGAENLSFEDIKIVDNSKVAGDKTGYKKFKVTIKKDLFGGILSELASITKVESGGEVVHRVTDLRVIGNTNRKFLSSSEIQLSPQTYTFKPTGGKVNKSTRVLVSIPENYNETGNCHVFIQRSRDKAIYEVPLTTEEEVEWLAKFMGNYFLMEFRMANTLLKLQDNSNPLNEVMKTIIKTNNFKVAPRVEQGKIKGFTCKSNMGGQTDWLKVGVMQVGNTSSYTVYIMSDLDKDWYKYIEPGGKKNVDFNFLESGKLLSLLYQLFNEKDWSKYGIDLNDDETRDLIMTNKLTYRELKKAYVEIYNQFINEGYEDSTDEVIGIEIENVMSKIDTKLALTNDYNAEAIIGKTKYIKQFILTYLGVQLVGEDKRHGSKVITDTDYYTKYGVRDERPYEERERTVLKKGDGVDRNYNARIYMFQLEYELKGKKYVYRSRDFESIKSNTGFLTSSPIPTKLVV